MGSMGSDGQPRPRHTPQEKNRRDAATPRLQYEALVEVGGGTAGGFEAESVDVSLDGMRMRTAYLPEHGERLVCRFDGFGGEIIAEAEVIWRDPDARGGEFGIRFTNLDQQAFGLLEDLCEQPEGDEPPAPPQPSSRAALPGSRVRLHIDGLGSPMRARVRETARGEVLIGSNLEFLRVGRGVELEDIEHSRKRVAQIEHVGVEIDPETQVPQLVVALSYPTSAPMDDEDLTTLPFQVRSTQKGAQKEEITPEPTVIDSEETPSFGRASLSLSSSEQPGRVVEVVPPKTKSVQASAAMDHSEEPPPATTQAGRAPVDEDDEEIDPSEPALAGVRNRVGAIAAKLGPTLEVAGKGARSALASVLRSVQAKREHRRESKERAAKPRRKTAPPPSGALRSDGRRGLVRDHSDDDADEQPQAPVEPKSDRKRAVFGAVLGVMAVLAIYFAASRFSRGVDAEPDPALAAAETAAAPLPPPEGAPVDAPAAIPTAEVPLFGATPLSTTEPVPVPPDPNAAADDEGAGDAEGDPAVETPAPAKPANLQTEWGVGEVSNPTELRLKMNGTIEGFTGKETATGFTITIPGRKSISSAAGFKRKDNRIDSVNVVNYPDRAEVVLLFKKDVPAFLARANGTRLVIEIANEPKPNKKERQSSSKKKKKKR